MQAREILNSMNQQWRKNFCQFSVQLIEQQIIVTDEDTNTINKNTENLL
jgi:hypothetical protein